MKNDKERQEIVRSPFEGDEFMTKDQIEVFLKIAEQEGIPTTGLTILGGKPYINVTGLDHKVKKKCKEDNLILAACYTEVIKRPSDNDLSAACRGFIKFFDREGFLKAIEGRPKLKREELTELREIFTYEFSMEGHASAETVKMSTMKNPDNILHMAERRATNRAKREAVGTGLTSFEELPEGVDSEFPVVVKKEPQTQTEKKRTLKIPTQPKEVTTRPEVNEVFELAKEKNVPVARVKAMSKELFNKERSDQWDLSDCSRLKVEIEADGERLILLHDIEQLETSTGKKVKDIYNVMQKAFPPVQILKMYLKELQAEIENEKTESG